MKIRIGKLLSALTIFCLIVFNYNRSNAQSQSYGLGFYAHEVIQDKRTSLDLFPDKPYCFSDDFEISFDMSYLPGNKDYFGYIMRLVQDDKQNIDLVYEKSFEAHFRIVIGEKLSKISFDVDTSDLFKQWNQLRFKFDFKNDRLICYNGKNSYTQTGIGLKKGSCFKIYFGAAQYKQFKITDIPSMKIRNIQITEDGKPLFYWPLNEMKGNLTQELISKNNAAVINPIWIKSDHYDWKLSAHFKVNGSASVALDKKNETVLITARDSLYTYSINNNRLTDNPYSGGQLMLLPGNQSLYSNFTDKLYDIYMDHKLVTELSLAEKKWSKEYKPGPVTDFWHFNKFFSAFDTSIYMIGGYGHFNYLNSVYKYHIPTQTWQSVETSGDRLTPRYLAALGANATGDSVYILGGYGSLTGKQIINPQNLYDMVLFDVKNKKFKKLYELKPGKDEFAFANSMAIDVNSKTYYALTFPNYKYNTELRLIKGSLVNDSVTEVGSTIPYPFHDIFSFADLYYSPVSGKFTAVTLLRDSTGSSTVSIYTLVAPPVTAKDESALLLQDQPGKKSSVFYIMLALIAGAIILIVFYLYKKKNRNVNKPQLAGNTINENKIIPPAPLTQSDKQAIDSHESYEPIVHKNAIFLFGEMQVFDKTGEDITKQFTPLIKELFLIILIYTIKRGRGVSSDKLNELLWFDKSEQSARNNRSVNIAKLKTVLENLEGCILSKESGYWEIELDYTKISTDYSGYLRIVKDKDNLTRQKIIALSAITQRGGFLSNVEKEWLDTFKAEISNEITDTYLHFTGTLNTEQDADFLIELTNRVFYFDPVNEDAMILKCRALAQTGKHSLAKQAFENFAKEYKRIYGENFKKDLQTILGG
ncbi:hypothetical protein ACI6Q2_14130 [Chitinophagaceae bacterium LWZ2-11]